MKSHDRQTEIFQSVASQLCQMFDSVAGGWAVIVLGETSALLRTNPAGDEIHLVISHGRDHKGNPVRSYYACGLNDIVRDQ